MSTTIFLLLMILRLLPACIAAALISVVQPVLAQAGDANSIRLNPDCLSTDLRNLAEPCEAWAVQRAHEAQLAGADRRHNAGLRQRGAGTHHHCGHRAP